MTPRPYTVVRLTQRTAAWYKWRQNGIGASDAPTIMGENRFQSITDLMREKLGPFDDSDPTPAQAEGIALEPEARTAYATETGKKVAPACLQSDRYEWMRASLDGITAAHDDVVEIKCGRGTYWEARRSHDVPIYYYGQVQHILAVAGLPALDFWCYLPGHAPLLFRVPRNPSYITQLLRKEETFWRRITGRP